MVQTWGGVKLIKKSWIFLLDQLFENNPYCQRCHNKQFLNHVWVFMAKNNVDNEPLVIHDSQGHFIMSAPGSGKLGSRGCRIWWKMMFDIGVINKFCWQIFLSILYSEYHLFLTNAIVCVSFEEIYFEQSAPCPVLEWRSTIFLTFQQHFKISGTIFMAPPCDLRVFFFILLATF